MSDGENDVFEPNRWVCDAETDPPDGRPFLDSEREIFKPQNPFFPLQFSKPAPSHPKDLETNRDTDNPCASGTRRRKQESAGREAVPG